MSDNYMASFFDKLEAERCGMSGVKLTQDAILDIRRDAERSCVGASVGDTLRLLDERDALRAEVERLQSENKQLKTLLNGVK